jgi:hypothetical protein
VAAATDSRRRRRSGTRGFSYGIGQSLEIVIVRGLRSCFSLYAHYGPAPGDGEAIGVFGAQVIGMRLDER